MSKVEDVIDMHLDRVLRRHLDTICAKNPAPREIVRELEFATIEIAVLRDRLIVEIRAAFAKAFAT